MEEVQSQAAIPDAVQVRGYRHLNVASLFFVPQKVLDVEEQQSAATSHSKVELQSLNTRSYLDHTVVPILLDAMAVVARER